MGVGGRGDLRQMRDAQDLPFRRNLFHLFTDGIGGFPADIGIHLVENEHGNLVLGGQNRLERQHHARHFARRRNRPQRFGRFAGIWRKLKFDFVETGRRK